MTHYNMALGENTRRNREKGRLRDLAAKTRRYFRVAISPKVCYNTTQMCGYSSSVERQLPKLHRWVRLPLAAPRRSKVRFAPTFFYSCGTKECHSPAPLLLLSKPNPLRWASVWFWKRPFHEIAYLSNCCVSSQAPYRLRRVFYASHQKLIPCSFCCSSLSAAIRFAGFAAE